MATDGNDKNGQFEDGLREILDPGVSRKANPQTPPRSRPVARNFGIQNQIPPSKPHIKAAGIIIRVAAFAALAYFLMLFVLQILQR